MGIDLALIAGGVGTGVLLAHVGEQELVVPCPLRAIHATSRRWNKLRIALVKRGEFKDQKDVALNPELEIADGKKDAFGPLSSRTPILFEASGKRLFLLLGLKFSSRRVLRARSRSRRSRSQPDSRLWRWSR
jgi:hypothetical protein